MTDAAMPVRRGRRPLSGAAVTLFVLAAVVLAWTLICIPANFAQVQRDAARKKLELSPAEFVLATWSQPRPVLPAPHQIVGELWKTTVLTPIGSPRNLLFHVWATLSTALVGLFAGVALGLALAFLFVHVRVAERIALPLVVCFQTIPLLAIAPMIVVAMGNIGVPQIWQKGAIVVTGVFFPITLVMVRGLRSPQPALPVKYPCLNAHGFGCAGDPNWFGCGNWLVQTRFAFGSCRYFFTEPCVPKLQGVNNHAIP